MNKTLHCTCNALSGSLYKTLLRLALPGSLQYCVLYCFITLHLDLGLFVQNIALLQFKLSSLIYCTGFTVSLISVTLYGIAEHRCIECIKGMKDKGVGAPTLAAGFNEHCQGHRIAKMHEIQQKYK